MGSSYGDDTFEEEEMPVLPDAVTGGLTGGGGGFSDQFQVQTVSQQASTGSVTGGASVAGGAGAGGRGRWGTGQAEKDATIAAIQANNNGVGASMESVQSAVSTSSA